MENNTVPVYHDILKQWHFHNFQLDKIINLNIKKDIPKNSVAMQIDTDLQEQYKCK